MQLSEESIKEFQEMYKKKFGEEIDEKMAAEKARRLLNLFKAVYGINNKNYESRRKDN